MANEGIFKPGTDKGKWPALVLVTFDETLNRDAVQMAACLNRLTLISRSETASSEVKEAAAAILKERPITREGQRLCLPDIITHGATVYAVDLFIHRQYLKEGRLTASTGRLPCLIEPGDQGLIWHLPYDLAETSPAFS